MSLSFVAMVTFHIPQIAPSSGWWVVLSLFFNKAGAHSLQSLLWACCAVLPISVFFFSSGVFVGGPDDGKLIRPLTDGDVLVELEWFRPLSVTFLSALLKCVQTIPECSPCLCFSLCGHVLIINLSKAVSDTEHKRPHLKTMCGATIEKRKCHLHLSHILSFVLIFPVDPVTCYFPLKQRFEIECSQTFCVDRIHKRLCCDRVQPSTSYFPVLTVDIS